jgi:hypothetical protein
MIFMSTSQPKKFQFIIIWNKRKTLKTLHFPLVHGKLYRQGQNQV